MSTNSIIAIERVLVHEGGYVNDPEDPGGETNWGITVKVARDSGFHADMETMNKNEAILIYRRAYWNRMRCDEMPFAVAFQVFDAGVNHGIHRSIQWLQRECGATVDGVIGPQTLERIVATDPVRLIMGFNATRITFYTNLDHFNRFGRGWMNRMSGNLRYAWQDLLI